MAYHYGKFNWFEHVSTEARKARVFYEQLLDWHTEVMSFGGKRYSLILNQNEGIAGYRSGSVGQRSHWEPFMSVPDVDRAFEAALKAGAKSAMPPTDFGSVGRGAGLVDPNGATFSLWHSSEGDRPESDTTPNGEWYWNELWTSDESLALNFYEGVFGYTHDTMTTDLEGTYYVLKKDGVPYAGLMRSMDPQAVSMWLPYVAVDDCDAIAARSVELGAQVLSEPKNIAGVGRYAILVDPVGAAIAVMRPETVLAGR